MTEPHLPTQPSPASPPTESVASPTNKHEGYFRNLRVPTQQDVHTIDAAQREREAEVVRKYQDGAVEAAKLIQRNYRGHRVRRELQGLSLTPSTRWVEVDSSPPILEQRLLISCCVGDTRRAVSKRDRTSTARHRVTRAKSRITQCAFAMAALQQNRPPRSWDWTRPRHGAYDLGRNHDAQ